VGCTANPGPNAAAANSGRQCFLASQVNSFHAVDKDTVIVRVGASRNYQLEILGTCPDINWSSRIGVRSTGGGSWICRGMDAELIVPAPTGFDRCPVLGVQAITPEAAKAARQRR
jgi:hypothetical protein